MNNTHCQSVDVLCVGHSSYDLIFAVQHHPKADEKMMADTFIECGGRPAANAAICVAKLGYHAAFAGYLVPARKVYFPKNARLFFNSTTQNFPDVLHQPDILCIFIGKNAWFGLFSASLGTPAQKQAE